MNRVFLFVLACITPFVISLVTPRSLQAQVQSGIPVENRAFLKYTTVAGDVDSLSAAVTMRVTKTSNLELTTTLDRTSASQNDTIHYTIHFRNIGVGPATQVVIKDSLDDGLGFINGSAVSGGTVLTSVTGNTLHFAVADVQRSDSGYVTFAVIVRPANADIFNFATATYASEGEIRDAGSPSIRLHVEPWKLDLGVITPPTQTQTPHVADTLQFRVQLGNPSSELELRNVVITNSLPAGLEFLASDPEPFSINGNRVGTSSAQGATAQGATILAIHNADAHGGGTITWMFDRIAPHEQKFIDLKTRVVAVGDGSLDLHFSGSGTGNPEGTGTTTTTTVEVDGTAGMTIQKSASALEVGTGEAVGFTITVKNTGTLPFDNFVIHDLPASGVRVQTTSVSGATLSEANGELLLSAAGLEPGATATVQYVATVTGARGDVLSNRAYAISSSGLRSDTAVAVVRVHDAALLSKVLFGKVWLDENGDGKQQSTERVLSDAVIWSSNGQTVRADSLGRFSFPDINTGRYTLRVDPLSVPAGFDNAQPVSVRVDGWSSPVVSFGVKRSKNSIATNAAASASKPKGHALGDLGLGTTTVGGPPPLQIVTPADNSSTGSNKLFVRVQGDPGAAVKLYDNGKQIREETLRGDGSADFMDITIVPGPHTIESVLTRGSNVQKALVHIHATGDPKSVVRGDTAIVRAGRTQTLAFHILDEWKKPVAQKPWATVSANGLKILDNDVDASSIGLQLPVDANGTLLVRVLGDSAGVAHMHVAFGKTDTPVDLIVLPDVRPLILMADGEIGAGASSRTYGTAVARGSLGDKTAVTLSYDSRRTHSETFGGAFDPLAESRYTVLGDASQRTVLGSATSPLSMKVEHNRDWLLLGDIDTHNFGSENSPAAYRRSLPGMSAHWLNGPVDLYGFGSMVAQQIVQKQLRGDGTSGPYQLGGEVRLGTDHLVIETRDRLNASIVLSRQELERFVDYDIDATTGAVLLRRPLASTDVSGNPMMLVATAEQLHGESAFVGGMHGQITSTPFGSSRDSIHVAGGYIEDQSPLGAHTLISGELGANTRFGGTSMEFAHGETLDSAGLALHASAWLGVPTTTGVRFDWNRVGNGFANPANPRLVSGTEDMRLTGRAALGAGLVLGASANRQEFRSLGAERSQAALSIARTHKESRLALDVGLTDESSNQDTTRAAYTSFTTRFSVAQKRSESWIETMQPLRNEGPARPTTYGVGTSYNLGHGIRAEASERLIKTDSSTDGLSTVALRSEFSNGTRAWTQYQLGNSEDGQRSAALVGIGQKLHITSGWSVDAQYERRAGLNKLPVTDVGRALPFAEMEHDHWAASVGTEWAPKGVDARAALRAELHDGEVTGRGYRIYGSGEAAINNSLSLLVREDTHQDRQILTTGANVTSSAQTILAAAFRPASSSEWNSLVKVEWRNDQNPLRNAGIVLSGGNRRVIGAAETVWTPSTQTELGVRLAMRHSEITGLLSNDVGVSSNTQYLGGRIQQHVLGRFDVRANARALLEKNAGVSQWDVAPAVGIKLVQGLDLETGYRFGDMKDVDFAQNGGHGFYATLGMSLTEQSAKSIADFWRGRLSGSNR